MIEYEYESLFANHSRVDLLIVESGASLTWNSTTNKFDVEDSDFVITNEEVDSESFNLDERLCSNEDLKFGKCEAAHLSFTIYNRTTIPNLKDRVLAVFFYFNNDPSTIFSVGVYIVDEDNYTGGRQKRDISAYDWNYTLNTLDITSWYDNYFNTKTGLSLQTIYVIADLFKWIRGDSPYDGTDSVSKDSPELPIQIDSEYTLVNGTFALSKTIESDTVTFGMFMGGILEFNGCFGHITREGKFKMLLMEWYTAEPVRTITDETRMPPTNYDDDSTWGIGQIDVYDRNNTRKFRVRNTNKKYPSTYVMVDPWILANKDSGDSTVQEALERMQGAIWHFNYTPCEVDCTGDLCVEVGDRVNVTFSQPEEWDTRNWFRSYVLERRFTGIQGMFDNYVSKGHKKQPKYQITNDRWHEGDSSAGTTGSGTGNVAEVIDEIDNKIIEIMRNYGLRVLDEPNVTLVYNKSSQQVEIKWEDPDDLATYYPVPLDWAGTIVVRKEGEKPLNRWNGNADGNTLVDSTTRDEYKTTAFVDNTIEQNKRYYYAIMPYHIALDDNDHPIKYYRWTKVFSVDTAKFLVAPTIFPITVIEGTEMTIAYSIPVLESGSYAVQKLVGKKGSIPTSKTDGTVLVDLNPTSGQLINYVTVTGLDEESTYYFVIFIEDTDGNSASSEPQDATTGVDLGWNYDYTGAIQTFTAPKTGIYSLETWGAQGGDATDGTNTARGGYGAYAYGEVLLQQGETIYINVGGKNGYGGGGNYLPPIPTTGWIAKAVATENGFVDDITGRSAIISAGSMGNYTWDSTNQRITCGTDGLCTFDFGIDYPQSFLKTSTAIEFIFYGLRTTNPRHGSGTALNLSVRFGKTNVVEYIRSTFSNGYSSGSAIVCSDDSAVGTRFDDGCCIVDDGRWDGQIIIYRFELNNGTITQIGQWVKANENAEYVEIRKTNYNIPLTIEESDTFKIEFGTIDNVAIQYYGVKIYNE